MLVNLGGRCVLARDCRAGIARAGLRTAELAGEAFARTGVTFAWDGWVVRDRARVWCGRQNWLINWQRGNRMRHRLRHRIIIARALVDEAVLRVVLPGCLHQLIRSVFEFHPLQEFHFILAWLATLFQPDEHRQAAIREHNIR